MSHAESSARFALAVFVGFILLFTFYGAFAQRHKGKPWSQIAKQFKEGELKLDERPTTWSAKKAQLVLLVGVALIGLFVLWVHSH